MTGLKLIQDDEARRPKRSGEQFNFNREVVTLLKEMYPQHQTEVQTGIYQVDFYLPEPRLVINIESAFHFYDSTDQKLFKSRTRERLLAKAGLNVLTLDCRSYRQEGSNRLEKEKIIEAVEEAIQLGGKGRDPKNVFYEVAMEK